ncbi:hypothetical protein [Mesorhizobium sp. NFR06]|uniref:hypothetical protein n=1 Tax=Mesorhizobium sp. NFR06 TaxID=1566290 RepID=UPI00165FD647|nr:hypothetical protein [Mesorhizobium sp. NFR06]
MALPDDLCTARNYTLIREFSAKNGFDRWTRVQATWRVATMRKASAFSYRFDDTEIGYGCGC